MNDSLLLNEPFVLADSVVHRLDPRSRISMAVLFSLVVALSNHLTTAVLALVVSLTLLGLARLPGRMLLRRLGLVNLFVFFLWFFLPFSGEGEILVRLGPVAVHQDGIALALLISLKSNAIICAFMALVATIPVITLGNALHAMMVPEKLVRLLLFTYRYIHVIYAEYRRLYYAALIRGFRPRTDLHTYKTFAYLVGMLLVKSVARAERVHEAMLCRGFNGTFHSLHRFTVVRADYLFMVLMLMGAAGLVWMEWLRMT